MEAGTGYPKKDFAFALLVMSSGTVLNIIYWGYELIFLKAGFYEDIMEDPVPHLLLFSMAPLTIYVGYQFTRELRLRAKMEEALSQRQRAEKDLGEAYEKLSKAYEKLESVDELKSNIIANVSHELLTPVTIIKGTINMALEEEDNVQRKKLLSNSLNAVERQKLIIDDLVEAGMHFKKKGRELKIEPVSVEEAVKEVTDSFSKILEMKKLELKLDLEEPLPKVISDREELWHILRNLVHNAIKFNREGGRVTISARNEGSMKICVSDTGIGIPKEEQEKIFNYFYQVDSSATRRYGGTGMGLSIAEEVAEAHGSNIWVESEVSRGSTFCFTLPVAGEGDDGGIAGIKVGRCGCVEF